MKFTATVLHKRILNPETIVLQLTKGGFQFKAGQYLVLSFPDDKTSREYSIYSGENEDFLEVLIKIVPKGAFTNRIATVNVGDSLVIDGPHGFFVLNPEEVLYKKHVFVASGTGISPFSSYIKTYPTLDYQLLHGIRMVDEAIEPQRYAPDKLVFCVSRGVTDHFSGRVTNYLTQTSIDLQAIYYLCGNSAMINDVSDILEQKGVPVKNIRTEAFF
ncbi:MAG: FAD-binding oxidoreductase [Salinivirgaceae bacterium]|jgi:ferredoxin--NADP+ reductase/benzoate/toluate 1,2-dioxygenase reductase subunit|nr:FAD-binding oxidoreductase [Salinivirgaceae bacterium]